RSRRLRAGLRDRPRSRAPRAESPRHRGTGDERPARRPLAAGSQPLLGGARAAGRLPGRGVGQPREQGPEPPRAGRRAGGPGRGPGHRRRPPAEPDPGLRPARVLHARLVGAARGRAPQGDRERRSQGLPDLALPSILALDQGTTSSRAIVFDEGGQIRAVAQREFRQIFPRAGWVEHDPTEIWTSQISVAVEALGKAAITPSEVAAVGITNQRETTIVWDRASGHPIHNAIVWQDRRTAPMCRRLKDAGAEAQVAARTGLLLDPYFSATKIAWLLDHVPDARVRAERGELAFGTVDSFLLWRLTAGRGGGARPAPPAPPPPL